MSITTINWATSASTASTNLINIPNININPTLDPSTMLFVNNGSIISIGREQLLTLCEEARKLSNELFNQSPYFDSSNTNKFCVLASRILFRLMKKKYSYLSLKFAYIKNLDYTHCFLLYFDKSINQELILDIFADSYGEKEIVVEERDSLCTLNKGYWENPIIFNSEKTFISFLKGEKWELSHVSLKEARRIRKIFYFSDSTIISPNKIQLAYPLDNKAKKYLRRISRGDLLEANLASLMIHKDIEIADKAIQLAKLLVSK